MREISTGTDTAWRERLKGGADAKPMARVTIQPMDVKLTPYAIQRDEGLIRGEFASMMFGQTVAPYELPNVKSVSWTRNVDQDVATCDLELWNTEALPLGQTPENDYEFDRPGYFTFSRGDARSNTEWGYSANGWKDMIVPDRIIRTYEGYGFDASQPPETDPHLYQTGMWLIDDVDYTADGLIRIRCRDMGRELIEQIMFPPVVPEAEYPVVWELYHDIPNPDVIVTSPTGWKRPKWTWDSSQDYIGLGIGDGDGAYINSDGSVRGHHGRYAFDSSSSTYWMSVGNNPGWSSAYEFVEGKIASTDVHAVRIKAWGGPYTVYVSVMSGGEWQGTHKIPYVAQMVDTGADIAYVKQQRIRKNDQLVIALPRVFHDVTRIRITFGGGLYNSEIGSYKYRAGAYMIEYSGSVDTTASGGTHREGSYGDLTDIVKWILAWGGFHWPQGDMSFMTDSAQDTIVYSDSRLPSILPTGDVWGDLESTGTAQADKIDNSVWDKKPLMDAISYVRDLVQYVFWIDEWGGAVFRSPNIWGPGNYLAPIDGGSLGDSVSERLSARTADVITIDENETLMNFTLTLSSRQRRDKIFIATLDGKIGAGTAGYNPYPSGTRRIGGYTDQYFATQQEAQVMADLLSIRMLFKYQTSKMTIPGNPAIQIDDQIEVRERVTAHAYRHYVQGIDSTLDMADGRWTYTLTTNWLGDSTAQFPLGWAYNPLHLADETQAFLREQGKL